MTGYAGIAGSCTCDVGYAGSVGYDYESGVPTGCDGMCLAVNCMSLSAASDTRTRIERLCADMFLGALCSHIHEYALRLFSEAVHANFEAVCFLSLLQKTHAPPEPLKHALATHLSPTLATP